MLLNKRIVKFTAKVMLVTLTCQLVYPSVTFALTTGPSQPEVQSFEPVGTSDMVDMFTGDFTYNIPLMDVEGYPINISYHSSGDMEQEASWVGLGWNINPGVINRSVRGIPDDFDGETISKSFHIKNERNVRVGLGAGTELAGVGAPILNLSANLSANLNVSNYRGVSADLSLGAGVNVIGVASAGINLGVSSQNGADIDYSLGLSFNSSQIMNSEVGVGVGVSYGSGYNTRSGLKDKSFSVSTSVSVAGKSLTGPSYQATIPVGIKNVVPVITNSSQMTIYRGQIKLGGEAFSLYLHGAVYGSISNLVYNDDGSKKSYGYLYAQDADEASIMDFTRDKDGMFNQTMSFLPLGNMTYDIYSVSGQGTGGSFRPFRNDFGSVYDPAVSSKSSEYALDLEAGLGLYFELGGDGTLSHTDITSGPWEQYQRPFKNNTPGSIFENVYFKQAGEATSVNPDYFTALQGLNAIDGIATTNIPAIKPESDTKRDPRGNLISYLTGYEAIQPGVASSTQLYSYTSTNGFANGSNIAKTAIPRIDSTIRKGHYLSEIVQTETDGRRYVYGIPAMNVSQDEYTFAVPQTSSADGMIGQISSYATTSNHAGRDNYYSRTSTPAFAHSYLLTSMLSTDYVDITGNGPSDDDYGSFTKFNYSRMTDNYHWRAPYPTPTDSAQYTPGFKSDPLDDKASYMEGRREQWMMHSVETKNFVAEFYTSTRHDGQDADKQHSSYKLDSIKLFNKHERFITPSTAIPIKTVIFNYDYSLCQGIPNTDSAGSGKLTLKKIFIRYGNSDKSMISPYQFSYDKLPNQVLPVNSVQNHNPNYSIANKDRWGMYKPNDANKPNWDFPFVNQDDAALNDYASAWSLSRVTLPSGGNINITYESDDYAYVQDKVAMEMFTVSGVGTSNNYSSGNQLYQNTNTPSKYVYFKRRLAMEKPNVSFANNYLNGQTTLYYNFDTRIVNNSYEPIKGYATVEEIGICPNDTTNGYIKVSTVQPTGSYAQVNPMTYMAINFARFYIPQVVFPGNDPNDSGIGNILSGLRYAFSELVSMGTNPIARMVGEGKAKEIKLNTSIIRLNSPGLKKKGGGQRVKQLSFSDNWSKLAGGNNQNATYGKNYDYTKEDENGFGTISSGVASYEPQIGGDENPFRMPVNYSAQSGSHFPPSDPVGLYQELPLGESLFPSPVVGYSRVTVTSIHQAEGISSQGQDIYDFYTAKDFPVKVQSTPLNTLENQTDYHFTGQTRTYKGSQGFTLVFNDMHGKPKRTEHRVIKPNTGGVSDLVSYKQYNYFTANGALSNNVPVIIFDPASGGMKRVTQQVGYEEDLTVDTREKDENTHSLTIYGNLNVFPIGIIPIPFPLPWIYPYEFNFKNHFNSVVATKVVQQYGILKEVQSSEEGALTTVTNEAFDPVSGQAIITSVNNEFNDKEYSVNYPAYWGYKSMGPAYQNTGYTQNFSSVAVTNYAGLLTSVAGSNFKVGDELFITYKIGGAQYQNNVWVTSAYVPATSGTGNNTGNYMKCGAPWCNGMAYPNLNIIDTVTMPTASPQTLSYGSVCTPQDITFYGSCGNLNMIIKPRYKKSWPQNATLTDVHVKVIRSGAKNQLSESIESYTMMAPPFDGSGFLKDDLDRVISISAKTYSDTLAAILPQFDSASNPTTWDSLNVYLNGTHSIERIAKEYAYITGRDYTTGKTRSEGLFLATSLWQVGYNPDNCTVSYKYCLVDTMKDGQGNYSFSQGSSGPKYVLKYPAYSPPAYFNDYNFLIPEPADDQNWVVARTVTKYSPWGFEIENKDAIGNYTTAQYGYNQQLPVALAQNAQQQQVFAEGFEDYHLLQVNNNVATMGVSPFYPLIKTVGFTALTGFLYSVYNVTGSFNSGNWTLKQVAHTGIYSMLTSSAGVSLNLTVSANPVLPGQARYLPFTLENGKKYLVSYWFKPSSPVPNPTTYATPSNVTAKSNIIEGWEQAEGTFTVGTGISTYPLALPAGCYIDDIRILPFDANMKSFVYDPVNQKLIATLDENNFASFYEYDQEGNLVRTKKETEKGIITVMESRSANAKK